MLALLPARATPPSYSQGYARSAGESAFPGFWRGLVGAWVPALGVAGEKLQDVSRHGNPGLLTAMDPATDYVVGGNPRVPGYVLDFDGIDDYVSVDGIIVAVGIGGRIEGIVFKFNAENTIARTVWNRHIVRALRAQPLHDFPGRLYRRASYSE